MRFDIIDKKEFYLKKHTVGELLYFESHPLLYEYNEKISTSYINSKPVEVESFVNDFRNAIEDITKGWRDWKKYVTDKNINFSFETFLNNVSQGTGKLIEAPTSIIMNISSICEKHNVSIKTFESILKPCDFVLILIDDNYVIAKGFRLNLKN